VKSLFQQPALKVRKDAPRGFSFSRASLSAQVSVVTVATSSEARALAKRPAADEAVPRRNIRVVGVKDIPDVAKAI